MRILPVIREFTGTWRSDSHERLMLSEDEPGKVQALLQGIDCHQRVILSGELTVRAACAFGYMYRNGDAASKPSWWHKLLRITPKPRPWGSIAVHFMSEQDVFLSFCIRNGPRGGFRMNAEIRTQIGEIDGA